MRQPFRIEHAAPGREGPPTDADMDAAFFHAVTLASWNCATYIGVNGGVEPKGSTVKAATN
jgi:hypothetical protein